jgi:hypothetical protein
MINFKKLSFYVDLFLDLLLLFYYRFNDLLMHLLKFKKRLEVINTGRVKKFYNGDVVALRNPLEKSKVLIRRITASPFEKLVNSFLLSGE